MTAPFRLEAPGLSAPGLRHGFFTRLGGVSCGLYEGLNCGPGSGDDPAAVAKNRSLVRDTLGGEHLVTCYQIHSAEAATVTAPWVQGEAPKADALVTDMPGIVLGVLTADCAPVLFADAGAGVIGAAHAGWRGAQKGVCEATIEAMLALGARRENIAAAAGPCIAQSSYEVGEDLFQAVIAGDAGAESFFEAAPLPGKWLFDLSSYVLFRLKATGVGHCSALAQDTYGNPSRFYSFRRATHRQESDYGRQISAIVLAP